MPEVSFLFDGVTASQIAWAGMAAFAGVAAMAVASSSRPEGYGEPVKAGIWEGL